MVNAQGPYVFTRLIALRDTDAAGVVFFPRHFSLAHEAYESFLHDNGLNVGELIREGRYALPVVHAEGDYRKPLYCGERCTVTLWVAELRRRSYTIAYELRNGDKQLASSLHTTHAVVDLATKRPIVIVPEVRAVLESGRLPSA